MKNQEITLQTVLNVMNSKFEKIDKRLDSIDSRIDSIDDRLDGIDNRLDGIDNRLDGIDNRLDGIDNRLDGIDNRLDNMDIRITKIDADNKEVHEKILEELQKQGNTLTRLETEFGNKIAILFDANDYTRDRLHLFGNQQLRIAEQLEKFSYRISALEKAVFAKK